MRFLLPVLFMLLASSASAQPSDTTSKVYQWGLVGAGAWHVADIDATRDCLTRGTCKEVNPLFAWAADQPGMLGVVKGVVAGSAHVAVHRFLYKKGRRKTAIAANFIIASGTAYITIRNLRY